jgi:carboxylesterase
MIISTAEPFLFPGNEIGCLLIHGFTGVPKETRQLGEYLARQGYSVLGVRLAGHATQPKDLNRVRWQDWLLSVEDGYHLLKGISERIFVCGLSMGGALSLLFASRFPVAGIVAMSTPHELPPDPRLKFIHIIKWFVPYHKKDSQIWQDPAIEQNHIQYPCHPTNAIAELKTFLGEMQAALPKVTAPTLLIQSRTDHDVHPDNAEKISRSLGCQNKKIVWIDNSDHNILVDKGRERVFQAIGEFIQRISEETG